MIYYEAHGTLYASFMPKQYDNDRIARRAPRSPFPPEESVVFGNNVERLRTDEDLSKMKLCKMADISRPTLDAIERGSGDPKLSTMIKIAKALGVTVEELFDHRWWEHC